MLSTGGGSRERTYAIFLNFLNDYCKKHFRIEEQYMEENHCLVSQKNKDEHSIFRATIHNYQQRLKDSGYMDSSVRELLNLTRLSLFEVFWQAKSL